MKRPKAKPCPICGSRKRANGYGFAAGPLGQYEFCAARKCGELLDFTPDTQGMSDEEETAAIARAKSHIDSIWNPELAIP